MDSTERKHYLDLYMAIFISEFLDDPANKKLPTDKVERVLIEKIGDDVLDSITRVMAYIKKMEAMAKIAGTSTAKKDEIKH